MAIALRFPRALPSTGHALTAASMATACRAGRQSVPQVHPPRRGADSAETIAATPPQLPSPPHRQFPRLSALKTSRNFLHPAFVARFIDSPPAGGRKPDDRAYDIDALDCLPV